MRADVIVVGLGSMGAAVAAELAARGVSVLGVDRYTPPHDRGAHGGGSRIIRMAYMEGASYVPLIRRAYELWHELEARTGTDLLTTTGGLMLGRPDSIAVGGALATARAENLPHDLLDADQVRRRFPAFRPAEDEVGLFEEVAGLIRPEAAIAVLLEQARRLGADLRPGVTVHGWRASADGVRVTTAGGELSAARLVLAPGAWAPELVRLPVPLCVQRRVQHYWRPVDGHHFVPGRLPTWVWSSAADEAGYGVPALDGSVKAAMHHGTNERVDPTAGAPLANPDDVRALRRWLAGRVPALAEAQWLGGKPCLYTLTPDGHFVLGSHPDHPTVAVACGFSGHGFKFVPVVGEVLADLVMKARSPYDISLFDPGRFGADDA